MSTIHSSWVPVGDSAREIDGRAKDSTVASTATSRTGSIRTARASHSRAPARPWWASGLRISRVVTGAPDAVPARGCMVEVISSQLQVGSCLYYQLYRPDGIVTSRVARTFPGSQSLGGSSLAGLIAELRLVRSLPMFRILRERSHAAG